MPFTTHQGFLTVEKVATISIAAIKDTYAFDWRVWSDLGSLIDEAKQYVKRTEKVATSRDPAQFEKVYDQTSSKELFRARLNMSLCQEVYLNVSMGSSFQWIWDDPKELQANDSRKWSWVHQAEDVILMLFLFGCFEVEDWCSVRELWLTEMQGRFVNREWIIASAVLAACKKAFAGESSEWTGTKKWKDSIEREASFIEGKSAKGNGKKGDGKKGDGKKGDGKKGDGKKGDGKKGDVKSKGGACFMFVCTGECSDKNCTGGDRHPAGKSVEERILNLSEEQREKYKRWSAVRDSKGNYKK